MNNFDKYAEAYDSWFMANRNVLYSEVNLVAAALRGAGDTLSVGCGSGLFESILSQQYGIRITDGIEPSAGMAEIARNRGMEVKVATAEEASFFRRRNPYDTILLNGSPSYITDLESVVRKAYNAMGALGRIILIDVPKESSYGMMYNLAKALGTWEHPLLEGVHPHDPYPIEFCNVAVWRTTQEKIDILHRAGFRHLEFMQTLTTHPLCSNREVELPSKGYDRGSYVAIIGEKVMY